MSLLPSSLVPVASRWAAGIILASPSMTSCGRPPSTGLPQRLKKSLNDVRPTSDRLTRLRAAAWMLDDLRPFCAWLSSTIWFATGIIQGPDPEATAAEREDALERVAPHLARNWCVREQVRSELIGWSCAHETTYAAVKVDALRSAIWLAFVGDVEAPHTLDFHPEGWFVDDAGHKLVVAPGTLPLPYADRWASSRAIKLAEALALDMSPERYEQFREQSRDERVRYGEPKSLQPGRDDDVSVDTDADPAYLLLEHESLAAAAEYAAVARLATPAQRRLLTAWFIQQDVDGSLADAARAIGMSESTAYVHLNRLRATLRARLHTG